jgi:RNA polymerase sigma-70 factor (ECF subfamily)
MTTSVSSGGRRGYFDETHWSLISKAKNKGPGGDAALDTLCRCYQVPLYSYVRHRGFSPADAEDITQGFFLDLVRREALRHVDREKGRFRSFLLGSLKNFLANEWDRRQTIKRGGLCTFVSLDEARAEVVYEEMVDSGLEPDRVFDRAWALALLDRVLIRLRDEYSAEGRPAVFQALEPVLSADGREVPFARLAQKLSLTETAVRMAAMRLRRRFRKLMHGEILKTVANPKEAEVELRYLLSCL